MLFFAPKFGQNRKSYPMLSSASMSHAGVLSKNGEGFRFEEAVKQKRPRRNPKLYEGDYVSLVHRSDGKYACTLKHIATPDEDFDHHNVAFRIYLELIDALQIIR